MRAKGAATNNQKRFLTPQEIAEFLGMGHTFVYERLQPDHQEAIPHLRLGRKIKIDTESPEWNQWLTDRKTNQPLTNIDANGRETTTARGGPQ